MKKARYLNEISMQLAMVKEKIAEIHVPRGPLAAKMPEADRERLKKLKARKAELEELIIWYEPEKEGSNAPKQPTAPTAGVNPGPKPAQAGIPPSSPDPGRQDPPHRRD